MRANPSVMLRGRSGGDVRQCLGDCQLNMYNLAATTARASKQWHLLAVHRMPAIKFLRDTRLLLLKGTPNRAC